MPKRSIQQLADILITISQNKNRCTIAVDGAGASGKSCFAEKISQFLHSNEIIHFDDFYIDQSDPAIIGSNFDWQRLEQQVLLPLTHNQKCRYQVYNWKTKTIDQWKELPDSKFLIIEGVTAMRFELRRYLDYSIFIDAPYEIRLTRGLERDGPEAESLWVNEWMPRETAYMESPVHRPKESADLLIDGTYQEKSDKEYVNIIENASLRSQ